MRLVKKYPVGTLSRWEIIAEQMNRSVPEVTFMSARLKETGYRQNDSVAEAIIQETAKKVKRVTEPSSTQKTTATEAFWSQDQQKLLELAIVKYPKNAAGDRWQKIANNVPGKTKEECLARYKHLVEIVKAQKAATRDADDNNKNAVNNDIENQDGDIEAEVKSKIPDRTEAVEEQIEEIEQAQSVKKSGGKPRNKRKERKKRMEFSSDEDENIDDLE